LLVKAVAMASGGLEAKLYVIASVGGQ